METKEQNNMKYFTTHDKNIFYAFIDNQLVRVEYFTENDPHISVNLNKYYCDLWLSYCIEKGEESTKEEFLKAYNEAHEIINSTFQKL